MLKPMRLQNTQRGLTTVELLIAAVLAFGITAAGFEYFRTQHQVFLSQSDMAEMGQNASAVVMELRSHLRNAGYKKLAAQPTYLLQSGAATDTLTVYHDSTSYRFYLDTTTDPAHPKLLRKTGNGAADVYAEDVEQFLLQQVGTNRVRLTLTVRTGRVDPVLADDYHRQTFTYEITVNNQ